MRYLLAALLTLLVVGGAQAQTTTTSTTTTTLPTFPAVRQGTIADGGALQIMSGQACSGSVCEAPMLHVMASATAALFTDCTGTCQVKLQCRPPGFTHDVLVGDSGSLSTAASVALLTEPCPWLVPQITTCGSGTCSIRAWIVELHGTY